MSVTFLCFGFCIPSLVARPCPVKHFIPATHSQAALGNHMNNAMNVRMNSTAAATQSNKL